MTLKKKHTHFYDCKNSAELSRLSSIFISRYFFVFQTQTKHNVHKNDPIRWCYIYLSF